MAAEVDQVLTKDDEFKLTADTAIFAALQKQINYTNQGPEDFAGVRFRRLPPISPWPATSLQRSTKVLTLVPGT